MIDDTTLVTLHKDLQGNISPFANKYNFSIQNDTLHLYGIYFTGSAASSGSPKMFYIDELWVKE